MKKAVMYKKIGNEAVQCLACSWYCVIKNGQTGICGIRENKNGKLFLLTYGKPFYGMAVDPIEKKPFYHFFPGTPVLSFGTYGCNFACEFCQNWEMSQYPRIIKETKYCKKQNQVTMTRSINLLKNEIIKSESWEPERIVEYAKENNIPSIAYTYNEPAVFFEYAFDTAKLAHKKDIKNTFVSNGFESKEAMIKIHPYLNAINIDLKSFSENFYLKICKSRLQPVLENIKRCFEMGIWIEVTTLIIPTLNDSQEEIKNIAEFLVSVSPSIPWHLSAYHPDYKIMNISPTPYETLLDARQIGKKAGLKYIYIGNTLDRRYSTTRCQNCDAILIDRNDYYGKVISLNMGKCAKCGVKIEGVWS